jgi:L-xylulokinase
MAEFFLGIDAGSTMVKSAVFSPEGREVGVASRKVPLLVPQAGHNEIDMESLWRLTAETIRDALEQGRVTGRDVAAVGCTGRGNGLCLVDSNGRTVRPGITGSDTRARSYVDDWLARGVDQVVLPKTMQSLWPAQPNALLAWMQDHEPETLAASHALLGCKDFIRLRLTGEIAAELTDMSGTSLLNVGTGDYDASVLEAFGIAELQRLLPPLRASEQVCGQVTNAVAEQTGLIAGTPVAAGMFDIDACGLASGLLDESQLCMIAGTWGNNQYIAREPVVSSDVFMTTRYAVPGYFLVLEGSATSASNLEWFVSEFFQAERALADRQGQSVYDICNACVAETRPEESTAVFLPFLYGCNVDPDGKGCLLGWDGWQTRGHVIRAVYEGIVFSHLWHLQRLLQFRSQPETVRLSGGAARSEVWLRVFADILQIPIEVPAGTELGALGAAIAASIAAGCYTTYDQAVSNMVQIARRKDPDRTRAGLYQEKYQRYQQAAQAMQPLWSQFAS